jgi:hypothetical protein
MPLGEIEMNLKSIIPLIALITLIVSLVPNTIANAMPLKVVELNTWGVPYVVKDTFRYAEAMKAIEGINPDFVVLEEVFSHKGKKAFHSENYPYEVRGPRAFPRLTSSGLRILSKYPVLRSAQTTFSHCVGDDCLSHKGAVIMLAQLPNGKTINILATHTNSRGDDSVRISQLNQIKLLIDTYADPNSPLIMTGDFNFGPKSASYQYMMETIQGKDTWLETHAPTEHGITYDAFKNSYAHDYCISTHDNMIVDRIDFMIYRSTETNPIKPISSSVIFNQAPLYSDHYGLEADFEIAD